MTLEMREGRGCGPAGDYIELHLEHLDPALLEARLPGITETSRIFTGVDIRRQPIPITPTVHYTMGGVPADIHSQALTRIGGEDRAVPGLMTVGEAACVSVHGANRLGSNSLVDLVVFGKAAADRAALLVKPGDSQPEPRRAWTEPHLARFDRLRAAAAGGTRAAELRLRMPITPCRKRTPGCSAPAPAFSRETRPAAGGARESRRLRRRRRPLGWSGTPICPRRSSSDSFLVARSLCRAVASALARTESRGAQARRLSRP